MIQMQVCCDACGAAFVLASYAVLLGLHRAGPRGWCSPDAAQLSGCGYATRPHDRLAGRQRPLAGGVTVLPAPTLFGVGARARERRSSRAAPTVPRRPA